MTDSGPGNRPLGKWGIIVLLLVLSMAALLDAAALVWIWPSEAKTQIIEGNAAPGQAAPPAAPPKAETHPTRVRTSSNSPDDRREQEPIRIGEYSFHPTRDQRLLWIVLLAGSLGGIIHGLRSSGWYVGNRRLVASWVPWYFFLSLLGALVSIVFYLVIRGGFFAPGQSGESTNTFGFAAFSCLIGLFTNQALLKLQQTFESLLAAHEQGKDRIHALAVKAITPNQGPHGGGTPVKITGTGFNSSTKVKFGSQPSQITLVSDAELSAVAPPQTTAGPVDVEITNPDGQSMVLPHGFTYT